MSGTSHAGVQSAPPRIVRADPAREARYADTWRQDYRAAYSPFLKPNMTILDVGSGRRPAIPIDERPAGCVYIGLDIAASELDQAPAGSYDRVYACDLMDRQPDLEGTVDLAISWQVLEHIENLDLAVENVRQYLKPGGAFVSLLSGRNAHFAVINRLIPASLGTWAMRRLLDRAPDSVFRAHYDRCTASGLMTIFGAWPMVRITPRYRGGSYFSFSRILTAIYLRFEDWCAAANRDALATHYFVVATTRERR